MSKIWTVRSGIAAVAVAVASVGGTAQAADRGSSEDQLACTPDVYRLCSSYVPDEDAITACLKRNVKALSPACNRVFTRPDNADKPQEDDD